MNINNDIELEGKAFHMVLNEKTYDRYEKIGLLPLHRKLLRNLNKDKNPKRDSKIEQIVREMKIIQDEAYSLDKMLGQVKPLKCTSIEKKDSPQQISIEKKDSNQEIFKPKTNYIELFNSSEKNNSHSSINKDSPQQISKPNTNYKPYTDFIDLLYPSSNISITKEMERLRQEFKRLKNIPENEKNLMEIEKIKKLMIDLSKETVHYSKKKSFVPGFYEKDTREVVPTVGNSIGEGRSAKVYVSRNSPSKVVKKAKDSNSNGNFQKEFEISKKIEFPYLLKHDLLIIKDYPSENKVKHKLLADKIEGVRMSDIYNKKAETNSKETTLKLISEAKATWLHLFDKNIAPRDVNGDNIFVENNKNQLKICDFEYWTEVDEPTKKTFFLLLSAVELCGWITRASSIIRAIEKQKWIKEQQSYEVKKPFEKVEPLEEDGPSLDENVYFSEYMREGRPSQVLTYLSSFEKPTEWEKKLIEKIKITTTDEERIQILKDYFDHVNKTFEKTALKHNLK